MSNLIIHMAAISARAAQLNCKVIGVLDNVILCQRGDNTFITWRVGVYAAGIDFTSGCYDMTQGAANKNLIERALGEQPAPVKTYVVWSAYKAEGCNTYEELLALEKETDCSISSIIVTHDIEQFETAVLNEWDGDLLYHLLEDAS